MAGRPRNRHIPASLRLAWGFAYAVKLIEAALREIQDDCLTEDQARFRDSLYDLLDELTPTDDRLTLKPTNQQLADKYAVSPRTVTNWRKQDCPFEAGQWRVLDWMAERRYVPARAKAKFARQLERRTCQGLDGLAGLEVQAKALAKAVRALGRF